MTVWCWNSYYATRTEPVLNDVSEKLSELIAGALAVGEEFGACHIVLSDINIERDHIEFCLAQPEITPEGRVAMEAMQRATCRDRAIALCSAHGEKWGAYTEAEWANTGMTDDDLAVDFDD